MHPLTQLARQLPQPLQSCFSTLQCPDQNPFLNSMAPCSQFKRQFLQPAHASPLIAALGIRAFSSLARLKPLGSFTSHLGHVYQHVAHSWHRAGSMKWRCFFSPSMAFHGHFFLHEPQPLHSSVIKKAISIFLCVFQSLGHSHPAAGNPTGEFQ